MFAWIQVLRGIAATMVVCVHYVASQSVHGRDAGEWLHQFGGSGVDIFFVISGFIMMIGQFGPAPNATAASFLMRRLVRIAPLYWVLTAVAFLLTVFAGAAVNARYPVEKLLMSLLFLPYSESYLVMSSDAYKAYVIPMAWTLTYEWYFYLVFAMTLSIGLRAPARLWFFALWFGAAAALGLLLRPLSPLLQMMTSPLTFEFLAGCAIAMLYMRGVRLSSTQACVAGIAGILLLSGFQPGAVLSRTIVWGGAAFLLVSAAALVDGARRAHPWRALVRLGDISYALYLSHFFTVALFVRIQARSDLIADGFAIPAIVVFSALCIGVAEVCYRLVEEPARIHFARRVKRAAVA